MSKFTCEKCCYDTNIKFCYSKHLLSKKHINNSNQTLSATVFQCDCNKKYKTRNGLSKHKQKCNFLERERERQRTEELENNVKMILEILKTNNCQQLITQNNTIQNSNNNEFNINVFLNDKCKNAMNILDFVKTITVDMEDATKFKELGYVDAMTQIITNALMKHSLYDRPLHYIENYDNNEIHIRHHNIWKMENDEQTPILDVAIGKIDKTIFEKIKTITTDQDVKSSLLKGSYTDVRDEVKYDVLAKIMTEIDDLIDSS